MACQGSGGVGPRVLNLARLTPVKELRYPLCRLDRLQIILINICMICGLCNSASSSVSIVMIQDGCSVSGWLGSSVDLAFFPVGSEWCFSEGGEGGSKPVRWLEDRCDAE